MDIMKTFLFIAFAILQSAQVLAETQDENKPIDENWFQVELVVFHNASSGYLVDLPRSGEPDFNYSEYHSLVQGTVLSSLQLPMVPETELELTAAKKALARSRNYRPLFIAGWKMYLPPEQNELPIRIEGGDSFDNRHELEGYITVRRNRYLHLEANLALISFALAEKVNEANIIDSIMNPQSSVHNMFQYQNKQMATPLTQPAFPSDATESSNDPAIGFGFSAESQPNYIAQSFQLLKESRRLRSGELHYLDHPAFGVLLRIDGTTAPITREANAVIGTQPIEHLTQPEIPPVNHLPAADSGTRP